MENDFKKEARKQYLHYFRVWFIILAVLLVVLIGVKIADSIKRTAASRNEKQPAERVYDYADVLTDQEEDRLRQYIAEKEQEYKIDIVLVTINEEIESHGDWELVMMNKADDFYDHNNYGYDKVHGDGVLLLDNWYEDENGSQKGSWLSTCGRVYEYFAMSEINEVLDEVYYLVDNDPYGAYKAYVDTVCRLVGDGESHSVFFWACLPGILLITIVVAAVYAAINLHQSKAKDTTTASTYVSGGKPVMKVQRDDFIRKSVTKRTIQSSSSGGGHSSSGGHGGSHRSSSGVSHGGGGRRR
ncbi:MAG: TPM domain-containing protein [Lachnospiraceae bacterium]|nr:TPM domain-containing protein [Lachnospiraceae bacterium]